MSTDRVLVPVVGIGVLALDVETYRQALAEGALLQGPAPVATGQPLLDAEHLAAELSLPVSWIEGAARTGKIPSSRAGRWVRFDLAAVKAALANGKQR